MDVGHRRAFVSERFAQTRFEAARIFDANAVNADRFRHVREISGFKFRFKIFIPGDFHFEIDKGELFLKTTIITGKSYCMTVRDLPRSIAKPLSPDIEMTYRSRYKNCAPTAFEAAVKPF